MSISLHHIIGGQSLPHKAIGGAMSASDQKNVKFLKIEVQKKIAQKS
jgi:hypothetical protein